MKTIDYKIIAKSVWLIILGSILLTVSGIILIFSGCKKDSNPSVNLTETEQQLVGVWRSDTLHRMIKFTDKLEFVDSSGCSGTTCIPLYVIHGNFHADKSYIHLNNLVLTSCWYTTDTNTLSKFYYTCPQIRIEELDSNTALLADLLIMFPEDPANPMKLTGKWTTDVLVSAYDKEQNPIFIKGNDHREYVFESDSAFYSTNHILQYGSKTDTYTFNHLPYTYVESGYSNLGGDNVFITFQGGSMYLKYPTRTYSRISAK